MGDSSSTAAAGSTGTTTPPPGQTYSYNDVPMALIAAGGITNASQAYFAGGNNATALRLNAKLDDLRARQALEAGDLAGRRIETKADVLQGAQQASFAAQGVQVVGGTASAVQASSRATSSMDDLVTRTLAARQSYALSVQGANESFEANQIKRHANEQAIGSLLSATSEEALYQDPSYKSRWSGSSGGRR